MIASTSEGDQRMITLATRAGATFPRPILHLGCGQHAFGDLRMDFVRGAANMIADLQGNIPVQDSSIGTVFSRHFLEHVADIGRILQEMRRVLRPHGEAIIITDNGGYLTYHAPLRTGIAFHRPGGYHGIAEQDQHYALFTDAHLMNHFTRAGFELVSVEYVDSYEVGKLDHRPPLQQTHHTLRLISSSLGQVTEPYLVPHILAIGRKPG